MPKPKPDDEEKAIDLQEDLGTRPTEPVDTDSPTNQRPTPAATPTTSVPTRTRRCRIQLEHLPTSTGGQRIAPALLGDAGAAWRCWGIAALGTGAGGAAPLGQREVGVRVPSPDQLVASVRYRTKFAENCRAPSCVWDLGGDDHEALLGNLRRPPRQPRAGSTLRNEAGRNGIHRAARTPQLQCALRRGAAPA
jgi:hypothetical protein